MNNPSEFIKGIGAALSEDGKIAVLQVQLANGRTVNLPFPAESTGSMLLTIEQALGKVFEMQRARLAGHDPRAFFAIGAKRVKAFQGAIASDGTPVLSLVLETDLRLDFGLPKDAIPQLISWLQEFEEVANKPSEAPH